jgi:outer membrane immunogenic protein
MKRIALTFAFLCATCALTFAGPEPMRSSGKEVMQQPVMETSCFEGWYFGIHGGATLSNFDQEETADEASLGAQSNGFVSAFDRSKGGDGTSGEGGLHIGYNWVRGKWVFGVEGDISATALDQNSKAVASVFLPNNTDVPFTTAVEGKSTVDWYSTLRPRIGRVFGDRVMLFVTGGVAVGEADLRERTVIFALREENPSIDRNSGFNEDRGIKVGWTAGGGLDFCLTPHVTLNLTYLYTDLEDGNAGNDVSFVSDDIPRSFDTHSRASSNNAFHTFRGGLSFHF